jgi:hypothetical protein
MGKKRGHLHLFGIISGPKICPVLRGIDQSRSALEEESVEADGVLLKLLVESRASLCIFLVPY